MYKMKEKSKVEYRQVKTLLVANRGEIASRIIRTCRKLGIRSVAVYSDADQHARYVREADLAVHIGPPHPGKSYLNQDSIISAAKKIGADAIHPGYGFLSENYEFAKRCDDEGILFIGPHPDAINKMGSKAIAKSIMEEHDVPVIPGYQGEAQNLVLLKEEASKIGYPMLLKASAGGGGKGMRIVHSTNEFEDAVAAAQRESKSAFGDDRLIIEKYVQHSRHIEIQIFGDKQGNVIHLFERECSLQRRYQKIIEEAPSSALPKELRNEITHAAVKAAKALAYDNAGTVEFILDTATEKFYFLEVNTRLQVEHPVTEAITGLDLVALQIASAEGKPLPIDQGSVDTNGYALEARIYAEDPGNNFRPVTGKIVKFKYPETLEGFRIETAVEDHSEISIFYDPMIAKVIMWSHDRRSAIQKMNFALRQMVCSGITTNLSFLKALTADPRFIEGEYDTGFVEKFIEEYNDSQIDNNLTAIAALLFDWTERNKKRKMLQHLPSGWRNSPYAPQQRNMRIGEVRYVVQYIYKNEYFAISISDQQYESRITNIIDSQFKIEINGISYSCTILRQGDSIYVHNEEWGNQTVQIESKFPDPETNQDDFSYDTPMPAQIIDILVSPGQNVEKGDSLVILSSMKMESAVIAENDGVIDEIYAVKDSNVPAGFKLLKFKEK